MLLSQCWLTHVAVGGRLWSLVIWAPHKAVRDLVACFSGTRGPRQKEHDEAHVPFIACLESDMPSFPLDAMAHTTQPCYHVAGTTHRCDYHEAGIQEVVSHTAP